MGRDRFDAAVLTQFAAPPRWPSLSSSSPSGGGEKKTKADSELHQSKSSRGGKTTDGSEAKPKQQPDANDPTIHWPPVHVLVCCLSGAADAGSFPFEDARRYVERSRSEEGRSVLVLTDLDLDRTLSDRGVFYATLEAGGLGFLLPRRAVARRRLGGGASERRDGENGRRPYSVSVVDRRDLVEVDGKVLLKPVMERPIDPDDPELRIYYKRSEGGGCKIIAYDKDGNKASSFLSDSSIHVRAAAADENDVDIDVDVDDNEGEDVSDRGFIYEEVMEDTQDFSADSILSAAVAGDDDRDRRYRKRDRLRDAAAVIVPSGLLRHDTAAGDGGLSCYYDDEEITTESDLSRPDRKVWIVTTASLPWMTGTAVNPLLRAAYLSRGRPRGSVTLVVPWLELAEDRAKLYGSNAFANEAEQAKYIREWLRDKAGMAEEADEEAGLQLLFYPSRYHSQLGSIFAMGDICKIIPDDDADVCILEEPEHLNWFRASGDAWTEKFKFVVGIVHTNYKAYASAQALVGVVAAPIIGGISTLMVRAYCHKVIKLSAVLQTFAPEKEVVSNVHGVRAEFLQEGERRAKALHDAAAKSDAKDPAGDDAPPVGETCVYWIGKVLWAKGLDRLLHLEEFYKDCTGDYFEVDIYGDGPELTEIRRAYHGRSGGKKRRAAADLINRSMHSLARSAGSAATDEAVGPSNKDAIADTTTASGKETDGDQASIVSSSSHDAGRGGGISEDRPRLDGSDLKKKNATVKPELPVLMHGWRMNPVPARFLGREDHAAITKQYKVIVNPSITEVLCTTTAEALAMGKFAIIPVHPSNTFFLQFPNCLAFRNKLEFAANLQWALTHEPEPLTEQLAYQFTWEAATERLIRASAVTMREGRVRAKAKKSRLDERIGYFYNRLGSGPKGDVLRKMLGAGPVSGQTKYELLARQRANSFCSEESLTFDRAEEEEDKRRETRAASMAIVVIAINVLFVLWRAVDWSQLVNADEV